MFGADIAAEEFGVVEEVAGEETGLFRGGVHVVLGGMEDDLGVLRTVGDEQAVLVILAEVFLELSLDEAEGDAFFLQFQIGDAREFGDDGAHAVLGQDVGVVGFEDFLDLQPILHQDLVGTDFDHLMGHLGAFEINEEKAAFSA